MRHSLFSAELPNGRQIYIAPVSLDAFESNHAFSLGDDTGYFIYEINTLNESAGLEILGKAVSYEAAMRLVDIFLSPRIATS
jgi:hypothetical protein